MKIQIWTDARLPGTSAKYNKNRHIGILVKINKKKAIKFVITEYQGWVKHTKLGLNIDLAEAYAILKALNLCNNNDIITSASILTDSRTIVDAIHNRCELHSIKHTRTRNIVRLIKERLPNNITITWIPRKLNKAHQLCYGRTTTTNHKLLHTCFK